MKSYSNTVRLWDPTVQPTNLYEKGMDAAYKNVGECNTEYGTKCRKEVSFMWKETKVQTKQMSDVVVKDDETGPTV